jgi:hypothetical protein
MKTVMSPTRQKGRLNRAICQSKPLFTPPGGASFGIAIEMLKDGHRVARKGWNGKGMFLRMVSGKQYDVACGIARDLELAPWIGMKTADGKFVPWLASQTDMLAEDWVIVEMVP